MTVGKKRSDFGFLSRAQLLEAKCRRLGREIKHWVDEGADEEDQEAEDLHARLLAEILNLEPQPEFKDGRVNSAVVTFILEDTRQVAHSLQVACISQTPVADENEILRCRWFMAPTPSNHEAGMSWSELIGMVGVEALATIEVLR